MPWSQIYRSLAERYGYTPDQINELTDYQIRYLLKIPVRDDGKVVLSEDEASAFMGSRQGTRMMG